MKNKILNAINNFNMLDVGDTIVAGVSGGADSMCLLHFLCSIKEEYNLSIIAAHINHNLRGEEAKRDELFVMSYCQRNHIPFELLSVNIAEMADLQRLGTEECARNVRYKFFNDVCSLPHKIATAHTLSDNVETVLFNLARGTSLKGIAGIPPVRGNIIRPLINITRQEVEAYCKKYNITYITDSTNLANDYSRNKIRHFAIPALKSVNNDFEQNVIRFCKNAVRDNEYINFQAKAALKKAKCKNGYACDILAENHTAVLSRCITDLMEYANCKNFEEKHIQLISSIIKNRNGAVALPNGFVAKASQNIFRVYKNISKENAFELPVTDINNVVKYNKKINTVTVTKEDLNKKANINKLFLKSLISYDIINADTVIRTRKEGDIFSLPKRNITKTVKKLFNESKIPSEKRDEILLLANGNQVLWIEGFGASSKALVTSKTEKALYIEIEEIK